MLRIHDDMLDVVRSMRGALATIDKRDPDLARQLRRAASSVVLNIAEGSGSFGRMRTARYRTALGSARETLACLRVAEAFGSSSRSRTRSCASWIALSERSCAWRHEATCARVRSRADTRRGRGRGRERGRRRERGRERGRGPRRRLTTESRGSEAARPSGPHCACTGPRVAGEALPSFHAQRSGPPLLRFSRNHAD